MTVHLSKTAQRRLTPPIPYQAGVVAAAIFEYTLKTAYTAATDIIDLGAIPATARAVRATVIGEGFTTGTTADIGIMDGEPGDDRDTDRALTADLLFDGVDVEDNEASATLAQCLAFPVDNTAHRSIGVTLSANEAASTSKKLTLLLEYTY
jgi:hypothetical protein